LRSRSAGLIAAANPSFERLTGLAFAQIKGQALWEMIRSPHHSVFGQDLLKALEHSNSWEGEAHYRRQNGDEVPALVSLVRVVSQEQKTMHYIAFLKDHHRETGGHASVSRNWPIATL
jgi:PAS domain S-box-containing protein